METRIKYIPVRQKNYSFYNSVIDITSLLKLTQVVERKNVPYDQIELDIFELEKNIEEVNALKLNAGIQRELIPGKLTEISEYLKTGKGLFPNSIIINISDKLELVKFEEKEIVIPDDPSIIITALDGQHRLQGYKKFIDSREYQKQEFEMPITIFYNTELDFQAHIFSIINSKQTKINKSLLYDLLALTKKEVDEFKLAHELAVWFQTNNDSILKENFKMLGKGEGWLSQAAFIDYLLPLLHKSKRRKTPSVFYPYLKRKEYFKIAFFINDYFKSLIKTYKNEFYSEEYIFRTSFTFGLFMKLMPYFYVVAINEKGIEYDNEIMESLFKEVKSGQIDFRKGGPNSGAGSSGKQNQLLNEILSLLNVDFDKELKKYKGHF